LKKKLINRKRLNKSSAQQQKIKKKEIKGFEKQKKEE
jgi:hypothetical protein